MPAAGAGISVVATVRDEAATIGEFVESVLGQSLPPEEFVIVDGGSSDGTDGIVRRMAVSNPVIRLTTLPGANISEGRNRAVAQATGRLVAVTDAGCHLDRDWLRNLVEPLRLGRAEVASGFFRPRAGTFFQRCLAAVTIPTLGEIDPRTFLPSSRSIAFTRDAWRGVDGYPEWLPICEDLVFDLKLRRGGFRFEFVPDAVVAWAPRRSVVEFFRQYYRYARGDGHARLWWRRHAVRYLSYLAGVVLLVLAWSLSPALGVVLLVLAAAHLARFWRRFLIHFGAGAAGEKALMVPVVAALVVVGDVAKMAGYPVGVLQRLRGRIRYEPY